MLPEAMKIIEKANILGYWKEFLHDKLFGKNATIYKLTSISKNLKFG
jgi:hypothetical protein